MASKTFLIVFAMVMAFALATAEVNFDDLSDADLNEIMDLMSKRAAISNEADSGMVEDLYADMEKRGRGRGQGKFFRCTHNLNGFQCVCDRRYSPSNSKYYRVCGYQ